MDLKNVHPDFAAFSNGGPAILKAVDPDHPYKDGQRVLTEIIGRKYTVVLPENGYDTLTIKIPDPVDAMTPLLTKATAAAPVYVAFDGFEAGFRNTRNRDGAWVPTVYAKATGIRVVDPAKPAADIDFD